MRNLHEQRRIVTPFTIAFIMAVVYALFVLFFFANTFNPSFSIAGNTMYDFYENVQKVDSYNVDEGERMAYFPYGARLIAKKTTVENLKKNDVIAFIQKDEKNTSIVLTKIFVRTDVDYDGTTVYVAHNLDSMDEETYTIPSGRLLGVVNTQIPGVGKLVKALTEPSWLLYIVLILLALILIGIPIAVGIYFVKLKNMGSPFPEGVEKTKLSTENLYIYLSIKEFLQSGKMVIKNGYDCDLVYAAGILFAVLHCTNGNIYLNINKDFTRHDSKIDRSGFICIPHVANLDAAKRRINSMYRAYFANMVDRRIAQARRRHKQQARKMQRNRQRVPR